MRRGTMAWALQISKWNDGALRSANNSSNPILNTRLLRQLVSLSVAATVGFSKSEASDGCCNCTVVVEIFKFSCI